MREKCKRRHNHELVLSKTKKIGAYFGSNSTKSPSSPGESPQTDNETVEKKPQLQQPTADLAGPSSTESSLSVSNDIGTWGENISSAQLDFWIKKGPADCQHRSTVTDPTFLASVKEDRRHCSSQYFYRVHPGTKKSMLRDWMCYSPSTGDVFCFHCVLFSASSTSPFTSGFSDWKNAERSISRHETNDTHLNALKSLLLHSRANVTGDGHGLINRELVEERQRVQKYWVEVLRRTVSVIGFLGSRGLAFRGEDEIIGSSNNGNFLGILELLSQFDPFLKQHLETRGNPGRGNVSYLSSTICDELISLLADNIRNEIITELKAAKYYSVSVDSTPDISHCDQLTIVVRYVNQTTHLPVERFLTFLPMNSHTGVELANQLFEYLKLLSVEITDCRGQSYDNASNMSGKYNGMKTHVQEKNPLAIYIPCAAHSLNLVGQAAVDCCSNAVKFFDYVGKLYVFFSRSTHRWDIMKKSLQNSTKKISVVKNLSDTRWSARKEAVKALSDGYEFIANALKEIGDDPHQKADCRSEAIGLFRRMEDLEMAVMTGFWADILAHFDAVSKTLQSSTMDLNSAVLLFDSLIDFVSRQRDRFEHFEAKGKQLTPKDYKDVSRRQRKANQRLFSNGDYYQFQSTGEGASASNFTVKSPREHFRVETFLLIIDQFVSALTTRRMAYVTVCDR